MKVKLKTIAECNKLIEQANELLGYPNAENGTLTYTDIPEPTNVLDGEGNIIDSYYEIEVSSEMLDQMMKIATEKLVEDTTTPDFEPEKRFEIKATVEQYLTLLQKAPLLGVYVHDVGIKVYEHSKYRLIYTNEFIKVPIDHRKVIESILGTEVITDRQTNGN